MTSVQVNAPHISAETGTFTDITVTSTATFNATTVSADTLTVGGVTVSVAEHTEVSASNGITVSVTTEGGSVKAVSLNAEAFGNAIHFRGVWASPVAVSDPEAGDIVVIGSTPATGFIAGQEYIYADGNWELIGDQNSYALNAYSSAASVFTGVATVPAALNAAGAAIDNHESRITAIEGSIAAMDASVSSSENSSIQVGVTQVDGVVTGVTADLVWLGADGQPIA